MAAVNTDGVGSMNLRLLQVIVATPTMPSLAILIGIGDELDHSPPAQNLSSLILILFIDLVFQTL